MTAVSRVGPGETLSWLAGAVMRLLASSTAGTPPRLVRVKRDRTPRPAPSRSVGVRSATRATGGTSTVVQSPPGRPGVGDASPVPPAPGIPAEPDGKPVPVGTGPVDDGPVDDGPPGPVDHGWSRDAARAAVRTTTMAPTTEAWRRVRIGGSVGRAEAPGRSAPSGLSASTVSSGEAASGGSVGEPRSGSPGGRSSTFDMSHPCSLGALARGPVRLRAGRRSGHPLLQPM